MTYSEDLLNIFILKKKLATLHKNAEEKQTWYLKLSSQLVKYVMSEKCVYNKFWNKWQWIRIEQQLKKCSKKKKRIHQIRTINNIKQIIINYIIEALQINITKGENTILINLAERGS